MVPLVPLQRVAVVLTGRTHLRSRDPAEVLQGPAATAGPPWRGPSTRTRLTLQMTVGATRTPVRATSRALALCLRLTVRVTPTRGCPRRPLAGAAPLCPPPSTPARAPVSLAPGHARTQGTGIGTVAGAEILRGLGQGHALGPSEAGPSPLWRPPSKPAPTPIRTTTVTTVTTATQAQTTQSAGVETGAALGLSWPRDCHTTGAVGWRRWTTLSTRWSPFCHPTSPCHPTASGSNVSCYSNGSAVLVGPRASRHPTAMVMCGPVL